jgi:GNAT superfamily N-acetyltransferase
MFHDMRQWWRGQPVPMAAVSAVRVAPEDRGKGIGRLLMTVVPPDPAAVGDEAERDLPVLRRAGPADAETIIAVLGRVHEAARDCGPITWSAEVLAQWLAGSKNYAYLCDDGFLAYHWDHANRDLTVDGAEAVSPATVRALWSHLGGYGSVAEKVYARVGPADAFWWLSRERDAGLAHRSLWMLRVIDAPAAIAARGFPAAVSLAVPLLVADDARPANSGHWDLTVAGGKGSLTTASSTWAQVTPARPSAQVPLAEPAPLTLGARGLAALYAGTPLVTLRQAGLVSGGSPDDDAALDAAFAAAPYMLDDF